MMLILRRGSKLLQASWGIVLLRQLRHLICFRAVREYHSALNVGQQRCT